MKGIKYNAYIYPVVLRNGSMVNPYIHHFINALESRFEFLNKNYQAKSGFFDVIKYAGKLDYIFLNWPEEVPERKGGMFQALFYIFLIRFLKQRRVKIIWTLHNKESHIENKVRIKEYLRKFTARNADFIITHAEEGVAIVEKLSKPNRPKIKFFHHPVLPYIKLKPGNEKFYDILIWGMITPYKGVDQFLSFIHQENLNQLKILVAGKIADPDYKNKIMCFTNDKIKMIDQYISTDDLEIYMSQSRAVLFTYLEYSILSSGALMDTLRYAPLIIGPDFGAFRDLKGEGLIVTYRDYGELKRILTKELSRKPDNNKIYRFIEKNSWTNFGLDVYSFICSQ